jgi:ribosomal protein S18 acetylase RimI-like enzyme
MGHILDNPIWHALTGPLAGFATGSGLARHMQRDVGPFSAIEADTPEAHRDLAADLPAGSVAVLLRATEEPAQLGWDTVQARQLVQMVADPQDLAAPFGGEAPVPFGEGDDMLGLARREKPGPFARRTPELGGYVGYREGGRPIAMGGHRMRVPGFTEVSAIAVDASARGRGLGAAIVLHLAHGIVACGDTPFLHVFPDNPAMGLYQRLGFRERARLWVIWRRPNQTSINAADAGTPDVTVPERQ